MDSRCSIQVNDAVLDLVRSCVQLNTRALAVTLGVAFPFDFTKEANGYHFSL